MAGLWGPWQNPKTGVWEDTFRDHHERSELEDEWIHNRQPVVLEPREYAEWLKESERRPLHLLRIVPDENLVIDPLGTRRRQRRRGGLLRPRNPIRFRLIFFIIGFTPHPMGISSHDGQLTPKN